MEEFTAGNTTMALDTIHLANPTDQNLNDWFFVVVVRPDLIPDYRNLVKIEPAFPKLTDAFSNPNSIVGVMGARIKDKSIMFASNNDQTSLRVGYDSILAQVSAGMMEVNSQILNATVTWPNPLITSAHLFDSIIESKKN